MCFLVNLTSSDETLHHALLRVRFVDDTRNSNNNFAYLSNCGTFECEHACISQTSIDSIECYTTVVVRGRLLARCTKVPSSVHVAVTSIARLEDRTGVLSSLDVKLISPLPLEYRFFWKGWPEVESFLHL